MPTCRASAKVALVFGISNLPQLRSLSIQLENHRYLPAWRAPQRRQTISGAVAWWQRTVIMGLGGGREVATDKWRGVTIERCAKLSVCK